MKLKNLLRHFTRHREGYLWLPLSLSAIYLCILFVYALTGRPVLDDPGALVGWLYSSFRVVLVVFFTAQVQEHLIGFRAEQNKSADAPAPLSADVFDLVATFGLLCFFAYLLQ